MKTLVIRQQVSLFNEQFLKHQLSKVTKMNFKIKRKGKRNFTIFFDQPMDNTMSILLAKNLGLTIVYQSEIRCVLSDVF